MVLFADRMCACTCTWLASPIQLYDFPFNSMKPESMCYSQCIRAFGQRLYGWNIRSGRELSRPTSMQVLEQKPSDRARTNRERRQRINGGNWPRGSSEKSIGDRREKYRRSAHSENSCFCGTRTERAVRVYAIESDVLRVIVIDQEATHKQNDRRLSLSHIIRSALIYQPSLRVPSGVCCALSV